MNGLEGDTIGGFNSMIGKKKERTANFNPEGMRIKLSFDSMSRAVSSVRCSAPMKADWKEEIEADCRRRKKGQKEELTVAGGPSLLSMPR